MPELDVSGTAWRKSSRSNGSGGNCVEVARNMPGIVAVRDSKDPHGPSLVVGCAAWEAFTTGLRAGQPDLDPRP